MKTIKYVRYVGGVVFTLGILLILVPFIYYVSTNDNVGVKELPHEELKIVDTVRVKVEVVDTVRTKVILTDTIRREVIVPLRDSVQ